MFKKQSRVLVEQWLLKGQFKACSSEIYNGKEITRTSDAFHMDNIVCFASFLAAITDHFCASERKVLTEIFRCDIDIQRFAFCVDKKKWGLKDLPTPENLLKHFKKFTKSCYKQYLPSALCTAIFNLLHHICNDTGSMGPILSMSSFLYDWLLLTYNEACRKSWKTTLGMREHFRLLYACNKELPLKFRDTDRKSVNQTCVSI